MHPKENTLKEEFKMTKFEIIGSEFQKEAASELRNQGNTRNGNGNFPLHKRI